jgi:hypothetical protein
VTRRCTLIGRCNSQSRVEHSADSAVNAAFIATGVREDAGRIDRHQKRIDLKRAPQSHVGLVEPCPS